MFCTNRPITHSCTGACIAQICMHADMSVYAPQCLACSAHVCNWTAQLQLYMAFLGQTLLTLQVSWVSVTSTICYMRERTVCLYEEEDINNAVLLQVLHLRACSSIGDVAKLLGSTQAHLDSGMHSICLQKVWRPMLYINMQVFDCLHVRGDLLHALTLLDEPGRQVNKGISHHTSAMSS